MQVILLQFYSAPCNQCNRYFPLKKIIFFFPQVLSMLFIVNKDKVQDIFMSHKSYRRKSFEKIQLAQVLTESD